MAFLSSDLCGDAVFAAALDEPAHSHSSIVLPLVRSSDDDDDALPPQKTMMMMRSFYFQRMMSCLSCLSFDEISSG